MPVSEDIHRRNTDGFLGLHHLGWCSHIWSGSRCSSRFRRLKKYNYYIRDIIYSEVNISIEIFCSLTLRTVPHSWSSLLKWNTSRPSWRLPLQDSSRRWRTLGWNPASNSWQRERDIVPELLAHVIDESRKKIKTEFGWTMKRFNWITEYVCT